MPKYGVFFFSCSTISTYAEVFLLWIGCENSIVVGYIRKIERKGYKYNNKADRENRRKNCIRCVHIDK